MKLKKVRFTVAISAYNVEEYIDRSIKSVLNQTFKNYELIVVDDCSTDNTFKEIKKYSKNKVRIYTTKHNTGTAAGPRNIALNYANGEYIIFLDGDDTLYDSTTLENIDKVIGENVPDIAFFGFEDIGQGNKSRISNKENSTKVARLICDLTFSVSSRCWRKEFIEKNNMRFIEGMYYEDELFCLKGTILSQNTIYGELKIFKYFRNRSGSVMSSPSIKKCSDWYRMLAEVTDLYEITPDEYKCYLLSFIENENESIPKRIKAILTALQNNDIIKLLPKRNYKYREFWTEDKIS